MDKPAYCGIYNRFLKRRLDIAISGAALFVLLPIYGVLAAVWVYRLVLNRGRRCDWVHEAYTVLSAHEKEAERLKNPTRAIGL